MADLSKVYGAGLRDADVKTADGVNHDIDAIVSIEADNDQNDTEIKGDDTIKATFSSGRKETLKITANGLTMDVIQAMTGNTASSNASSSSIPLGTQVELNPPFVEISGQTNGRAADGTAVIVKKVYHKVQINSIVLAQENEKEFSIEMSGTAVQTDTDIVGATLNPGRTSTLYVNTGTAS